MERLYFDSKNWCRATSHTCLIILLLSFTPACPLEREGGRALHHTLLWPSHTLLAHIATAQPGNGRGFVG